MQHKKSVDTASHVITAIEAHYADKKDLQCLPAILDRAVAKLHEGGLQVEEVLCDAGYSSGEALSALEQKGIVGYIPNFGQYKSHREGFRFNPFRNAYVCERGMELPFKKITTTSLGYQMKTYRSSSMDCRECPLRSSYIGKSDFKKIDDSVDKPYYDRMHRRLQSVKAKAMRKVRQSTVEPVLGTLINYGGMRRVNTRDIAGATKCMIMAAVAYNLKKLLKHRVPKVQAAVVGLKRASENLKRLVLRHLSSYGVLYSRIHAFELEGGKSKRTALAGSPSFNILFISSVAPQPPMLAAVKFHV